MPNPSQDPLQLIRRQQLVVQRELARLRYARARAARPTRPLADRAGRRRSVRGDAGQFRRPPAVS